MANEIKGGGNLELPTDINVITAQIKWHLDAGINHFIAVGELFSHVRDNEMEKEKGGWNSYCEYEIGISRMHANRFIRIFKRFGSVTPVLQERLPKTLSVLDSLVDFTDEELEQTYELPSGESKKPTEMSRREIEALKADLKKEREAKAQAQQQAEAERSERERLEEEVDKLSARPPEIRYETRTEYIEVDNTPHDYESTKQRLEEYRAKFGDLENYDEHITATHRQDMIVAVMSFSQGVREFIKRYDYMTKYKGVIDNLDEESKRQYDEAVNALKGMADNFEFTTQGSNIINAEYSEII